jgi:sulfite reductase (NADPH) flavoprotein alpha-component
MSIPYIPETAPFSSEQRGWLNGFLAGMFARQPAEAMSAASVPTLAKPKLPVTILWGSQTGNAESLAKDTRKKLEAAGADVTVFDLAEYPAERLADEANLLLITSTYGDGEPPDNAKAFHQWLHAEEAPKLAKTRFAILGLGDTNYPDFCQTAKDFDTRLEALGAARWVPRIDCDTDFDEPFADWINALVNSLGTAETIETPVVSGGEAAPEVITFSKKNPFPAPLTGNLRLNAEGSAKDTRHLEFSLEGSGLDYEVGDALGVFPKNDAAEVDALLSATGFDGEAVWKGSDGLNLRQALLTRFDHKKLTLPWLKAAASSDPSGKLAAFVAECEADRKVFQDFVWGREIIDVIEAYALKWETPEAFVATLKPITPRLYSISSSPKAHPGEVHLTVGVVSYESFGRTRRGLCSHFLAMAEAPTEVGVFVHANKAFKPPADRTLPMIMVGPGTGIAPFRAFLEEREATGAPGENWLFFGDQRASTDFLYRETLENWQQSGLLTRLETAFSRDQEQKIYVQDRMREHGAELADWLQRGAHFYVCGDASRMAKDVDRALREIVATHLTGGDTARAEAYVDELTKSKRYVRDVY